jgi:hypothetical protein
LAFVAAVGSILVGETCGKSKAVLTSAAATPNRPLLPSCPDGGIGRRTSFRCWRSQGRGGSSPLPGTTIRIVQNAGKSSKGRSPRRDLHTMPLHKSPQHMAAPASQFHVRSRVDKDIEIAIGQRTSAELSRSKALLSRVAGSCRLLGVLSR